MPDTERLKAAVESGETYLGLELGSTRIKAVLIDRNHIPIASGSYNWESRLLSGIWTYGWDEIWQGLQSCYAGLAGEVRSRYGIELTKVGAIGFSGMMHGYIPLDKDNKPLTEFRTWRNTNTGRASAELTGLLNFNIPQRWSIAHLYQAMLNDEEHVSQIAYLTTLSGYIHLYLTGQKVIGVGEASGMFPIDSKTGDFDARMLDIFNGLAAEKNYSLRLEDILPKVLTAGENAGTLSEAGALLLDPGGTLKAGIPVCPPEGDAGTGMVATNSVARYTGNISAGTSIFAMLVLGEELSRVYPEIDMVTTPTGSPVAMVHCNNCTSDIDAWIGLFREFSDAMGIKADNDRLYNLLYGMALEGDEDCGGLLSYNFYSGEPALDLSEGRPLFVRASDSSLTLRNFMRTHLFSALAALKTGMDILTEKEGVKTAGITGHGGFFKVKEVGQKILASALGIPVSVMKTAGEGGPWGMAVLAAYMQNKQPGETLEDYLKNKVFSQVSGTVMEPDSSIKAGFDKFMQSYIKGLDIERTAIKALKQEG